jgi:hypothetical protein
MRPNDVATVIELSVSKHFSTNRVAACGMQPTAMMDSSRITCRDSDSPLFYTDFVAGEAVGLLVERARRRSGHARGAIDGKAFTSGCKLTKIASEANAYNT